MRLAIALFDLLTALTMIPSRRLNSRGRGYKRCVSAVVLLVLFASVDRAFVLPRFDGWAGLVSLLLAVGLLVSMAWRWMANVDLDVPRQWRVRAND